MKNKLESTSSALRQLFEGGATQVTIQGAVEAFLRAEMVNKSNQTTLWYRKRLESLAEALGADRPLGDVMEADLMEWYAQLAERNTRFEGGISRPEVAGKLSVYTLHGHARVAKRFFKWLYRKGVLQADLGLALDLPKLPRSGRKGISDANVKAILAEAKGDVRDYAILRFLESTGARVGGVAHLRLGDLNLDSADERLRRRATVWEKGGKERSVILTEGALRALEAWLEVRPAINDEHVFLGQSPGQPWHALSERGIAGIIRRYKDRLGLKGKCSPHEWRHRWCRKRLQEGMDLSQVSQLAGHEDVSITVRFYGQFTLEQLQDAYDRFVEDPEEE